MKIRLLSDLHLEGYRYKHTHEGEDVLVLAGDIHTRNRHEEVISQVPSTVQIVLVAGNHEYYHSVFEDVNEHLKSLETKYPNFKFLNNESATINGVEFFGGTMFTDFTLDGWSQRPYVEIDAQRFVADFKVVAKRAFSDPGWEMWNPSDHKAEHDRFVNELSGWIDRTEGKRRVVVSHFVPTPQAIHPRWKASSLNGYFTADMERFMGWEGLWLFGHTHDSADVMIGDTRCVCNPRGYGQENAAGFNPLLIIEVPDA